MKLLAEPSSPTAAVSAPLYPVLPAEQFWLQKIDELDTFLQSEMETHSSLNKSTIELSVFWTAHALRLV